MAKRVQVVLVDDLDGSPADETVTFGLDGTTYEIDLSKQNAKSLRDAVARYVGKGTRVAGRRKSGSRRAGTRKSTTPANSGGPGASAMRAWAKENGYRVSDRGRISAEVREAYAKTH